MLLIREIKLLINDLLKARLRFAIWLVALIMCVIALVYMGVLTSGKIGFPQTLSHFFSPFTFYFPVVPLFLMLLSFILIPFFEPFRFIRYIKRENIFLALVIRIFLIVLLFTVLYLLGGFIAGGFISKRWDNLWLSKEGLPFLTYGEKVPLHEYFSTSWIIIRYFITSIFVFNMLGILVAIFYALIPRYIYSFIIVNSIILLDKSLDYFYGFSPINTTMSINMDKLLMPETFQSMCFLFGGVWLTFLTILYFILEKQDYLNRHKDDNGKEQ
ncbi:hypothetical protein [Bacillus mycoides]